MISVLCPTRMRPAQLERSVDSLYNRSSDRFEFLIAIDPDDGWDYAAQFGPDVDVIWRALERYGYRQLHRYYNALAERATGDWLLLWNDDAEMVTANWNELVERHKPNVVLSPDNVHRPIPAFPIVPARFVDALGHFSLGPHNDIWWQDIANQLGILEWIDVRVEHHRPDLTGGKPDSVHDERGHWLRQQCDELADELQRDVEVIRALLAD